MPQPGVGSLLSTLVMPMLSRFGQGYINARHGRRPAPAPPLLGVTPDRLQRGLAPTANLCPVAAPEAEDTTVSPMGKHERTCG